MYCITFQHSRYKNFGRVAISMPGLGPTSRVRVRICKVHFKCRRETFTAGTQQWCSDILFRQCCFVTWCYTLNRSVSVIGNVTWTVTNDDLRSPHECILIEVGDKVQTSRREVINWKSFDWAAYHDATSVGLKCLFEKWSSCPDLDITDMVHELTAC